LGTIVRMVQWPSYEDAVLARLRTDARLFALLEPLLGGDIKQIINQLHWKKPGAAGEFVFHQDVRFRRPREAYRNLDRSFVQTSPSQPTKPAAPTTTIGLILVAQKITVASAVSPYCASE